MGVVRSLSIGVLIILLTASLVGANATTAAQRTALDQDFVTTSLSEEDAYGAFRDMMINETTQQIGVEETNTPIPIEPIIEDAITRDYIQNQIDPNIERVYAYLHGNRDNVSIVVDISPLKEEISTGIGDEIRERSLSDLLELAGVEDLGTISVEGITIEVTDLLTMGESEQAYQDTRQDFRDTIRDAVIDRFVDEAFQTRSNDELLALVIEDYDPTAYSDAEKEQMVDDRETAIRAALRDRIIAEDDGEIDDAVDNALGEYRAAARTQVEETVRAETGDLDPAVTDAVVNLTLVGLDGLITEMTYDEFRSELDAAKTDLANAVAVMVDTRLDEEVPDQVDLTDEMGQNTRQQLETARETVQLADLLSIALPLAAIGLAGLLWVVSGSVLLTTAGLGIGLLTAGASGLAAATVIPPEIKAQVTAGGPDRLGEIILGIVDQLFAVVSTQSLILTAIGAILVLGTGLVYAGVIPRDAVPFLDSHDEPPTQPTDDIDQDPEEEQP